MELKEIELVYEVLPALVGLAVCGYIALRMALAKSEFFRGLRGWLIMLLVASLALLWISSLFYWADSRSVQSLRPMGELGFAVFASWLAVCMGGLGTRYSNLSLAKQFWAWFRGHPVNAFSLWGLVGIAAVLGSALIDTYLYTDPDLRTLWLVLPATAYLIGSAAIIAFFSIGSKASRPVSAFPGKISPSMLLLATAWILMPAIVLTLDVAGRAERWFDLQNPHSWMLVVLLLILGRAISMGKYRTMVIDGEAEGVRREGFREYDIPRGAYIVYDEKNDAAFGLFSELTSLPLRPDAVLPGMEASASGTLHFLIPQGFVVTREFPDKIRDKYKLEVAQVVWLTESPGERRIAPTSLAVLTDTIVRFMETNPNSIVLLEGIEYISTFNDFKKVLRFLDTLNESAWITKARIVLTVNPNAFATKDLALLERDRTVIRGEEGVKDLKVESRVEIVPSGVPS